ncbi:MAG: dephospho-CoA kinase [Gammaproteobacteria bacterium]|nr:MAG: dephospho-CoA kinase [Gammaproteobacteria bacterium]TND03667.1 MAG: dephospho-CoA kinase [Gammaproteobacteria bacterium]
MRVISWTELGLGISMLIIGLTGGIGSGKSSVARLFANLGISVIDADTVARDIVKPGMPALSRIAQEFGPDAIGTDKQLDRQYLRDLVFEDEPARRRLEAIMHPLIRTEMFRRARDVQTPYCVFEIPLLVETRQTDVVDRVVVVDCPEELQIERIKQRDRLTQDEIRAIMNAQATRHQRRNQADDVIVNDASTELLEQRVQELHQKYLALAADQ